MESDAGAVSASSEAVRDVLGRLNAIVIPEMTFFPPTTVIDAVDFFKQASLDYDASETPLERRGVSFELKLPRATAHGTRELVDPFAEAWPTNSVAPLLGAIAVRDISLHDALRLVCDLTDMRWHVRESGGVVLVPKGWDLDEDWATRSFNIPAALTERLFGHPRAQGADADPNKVWRAFFGELGVSGPEFARFEYLTDINKLRVTNTPQNLAAIEVIMEQFASRMIEVEMQIHAFRTQDIERLRLAGGVSVEALMALRQKGCSKPVASATALTKSGIEAVVKAVQEVIYPTELLTECGQSGSNVTSRSAANALVPGSFEVRETGMILQVIPEIVQNGTLINLMLNPTWVTLEGWESYPAGLAAGWAHKTLTFKQPVFGVTSFQTQVAVKDGGTVLLGSCSTPDGEWVQVGFLTARLREVQTTSSGGAHAKDARGVARTPKAEHRTPNAEGVCKAKPRRADSCSAVAQKMSEIVIAEMTFRPPATIIDAVRYFKEASVKYDKTGCPETQRGINIVLKLTTTGGKPTDGGENADPFAAPAPVTSTVPVPGTNAGAPVISALNARSINLFDALKLVCDVTGMQFRIRDGTVWIMPLAEPCDEFITRVYPVLTCMQERMNNADSHREGEGNLPDWKAFFAQRGVNWTEGSSVSYEATNGLLRVTSTPENLDMFEQVLEDLNICPVMVEVEVQICAFRPADIERLRLSGEVSVDALLTLRQKGKSRPVASATVLAKSGIEAVVKAVQEVLYPTEACGSRTGPNGTSGGGAGSLSPSNFEMREVGMCLQVVPEIATEHAQINVMLNPRWVTLDRWETYPADLAAGWMHKTFTFRQPVFGETSFQTQATVKDGGTVLLGSSSTPDGKSVHVGFLTVRRVDGQAGTQGCVR